MMKKKLSLLILFSLFIFIIWQCKKETEDAVVVVPPTTDGLPPISPYIRGVWLTNVNSQVLYSTDGIKNAVKKCRQNGINHIFAVMWNKGRTLYPSKVMQDTFGIPIDRKSVV